MRGYKSTDMPWRCKQCGCLNVEDICHGCGKKENKNGRGDDERER